MHHEKDNNPQLLKEIRDLKLEIAKLTAILAFKQMENEHPELEKLANGVNRQRAFLHQEAAEIANFAHQHLDELPVKKGMATLAAILGIGTIAYALLSYLGVLGRHPHR